MLLASWLCAPSTAKAGCSAHYISLQSSSSLELELLESIRMVDPPLKTTSQLPKPCTGAFCSGNPATPAPVSQPLAPNASEQGTLWHLGLRVPEPKSFALLADEVDCRPSVRPASIFHPPRLILS